MVDNKRKIAFYTGNRSDYGLQYPILKAVASDSRLEYFLIVSGAHLKRDFGRTLKEIRADGFRIYAQAEIDFPEDSLFSTAMAIGSGVQSISRVLAELKPDFLIVYGDRFESFAAVIAGTQMGIATAHIEGGDYTEGGALDDSVRHAMTKLAHLHFTTNQHAADRVLRLGEEPWRVFNVGLPMLDMITEKNFATPEEVQKRFSLDLLRPVVIFTQHSVATEFDQAVDQIRPSLEALKEIGQEIDCQIIITYPNDDAGGRRIMYEIEKLAKMKLPFMQVHHSLGRYYYHGVLNVAAVCVGNSSSGLKETPAFHLPCVNIGDRQRGRLRSSNIIDVPYQKEEIKQAIRCSIFDDIFLEAVRDCANPYGSGNAGERISDILASTEITKALIQKKMMY